MHYSGRGHISRQVTMNLLIASTSRQTKVFCKDMICFMPVCHAGGHLMLLLLEIFNSLP